MQLDEAMTTAQRLRRIFDDCTFFSAAVPTYVGGIMAFAWATDNPSLRRTDLATLKARYDASGIATRYYNPEIHKASFALPQYLVEAIRE
jgi:spermidine synthase